MIRIIIVLCWITQPFSTEAGIPIKSFKKRYLAEDVYQGITKTTQGQKYG